MPGHKGPQTAQEKYARLYSAVYRRFGYDDFLKR